MKTPLEVTLPITRVTCLEDRGQIERSGSVALPSGQTTVRISALSALAVDRSLKVELIGGTLVDARLRRIWRPKPPGGIAADASELRKQEKALTERSTAIADELTGLLARLDLARAAHQDLFRAIQQQAAVGVAKIEPWKEQLERLRSEEARLEESYRRAQVEQSRVATQLGQIRSAVARTEQPLTEQDTFVELTVDAAEATQAPLTIRYVVPCVAWRPSYRATLARQDGNERVELQSDAVVWQNTGESWDDVELSLSTARPTLGASPPELVDDRLSLRPKTEQEKRVVDVSIREEVIHSAGEGSGEMPGLDDGGEVRVLGVRGKVHVPSDGAPHRFPIDRFESSARTEWVCAPELGPLVSLVARFDNRGSGVLLAGPVELVRQSGFVGRGQLNFAAKGETVKLSFGSEDTLRVGRNVLTKEDENRLTGRRTTRHTVKLFASNFGDAPMQVAIEERVPVSEVKEVEVTLVKDGASTSPALSKDGIARFELSLAPNSQRELSFAYEISAAGKVAGV